MGIDYRPIVGVGKYFETEAEAGEWYVQKCEVSQKVMENLERYGLSDFLDSENSLFIGSWVNSYSAEGYYIYIPIESGSAAAAISGIQVAARAWHEKFGEDAEFITDISIY